MILEFRDNNTLHDDLFLHFGEQIIECDSYYFALDRNIEPDNEYADKLKPFLKNYLISGNFTFQEQSRVKLFIYHSIFPMNIQAV